MGSKVLEFWDEATGRKRPPPADDAATTTRQLLLPLHLAADHGNREAREQLLWKLGDTSATPAAVARAFCQQLVQQPQQLEREAGRLQKDLDRQLEQHKDLLGAPPSPTLVKVEVRVTLPHLACLFYDDPVWDLGAPRAACEQYVAQVCNDLGLDWQAQALIQRKMKDAVDAARRDFAAGHAQLVAPPVSGGVVRSTPARLPAVIQMTEAQKQHLREHLQAAVAAKRGQQPSTGQPLSPGAQQAPSPALAPSPGQLDLQQQGTAAAQLGAGAGVKEEPGVKQEDDGAAEAAAAEAEAAVKDEPSSRQEAAGSEQTSGQDMPDLPDD
ncbi:hypothetical protein ABPG75_003741 [Micractinium tetrahymenae]